MITGRCQFQNTKSPVLNFSALLANDGARDVRSAPNDMQGAVYLCGTEIYLVITYVRPKGRKLSTHNTKRYVDADS